ncbi:1-aminocyclopropane-1-carboxylate deaminase/D-cysteine desulfhydrase [Methylomicrobium sp. RS1]|uniref:1-aminocyclopropane-1-carboxylate deaminase/D-cysteine desulfhydrase n=1 Tax=Candidatus Methylomicrobium oryzae TaxID=2802053 RepID=UPI0019216A8E|nr:pyridoxal-phosphate dependent enzyme [Methylomicrobium sp. RS1]MBL1266070.1 pyridoxal-phosphate dependent enzyme [Methylomicrobium sp. RS1]
MKLPVNDAQRRAAIQALERKIPRRRLASYPTPLQRVGLLSPADGGPALWIKRDDLIGFALGGNKIRGLEVMLADATARGADTLITGAGVQSNHVRATAFAAAHAGLDCIAAYWGKPPAQIDGNYRVTTMLGAGVYFTQDDDRASVDAAIEALAAQLRGSGKRPYPIPRGGACLMGVLGHVLAVCEMYQQCAELSLGPDAIVLAVGSGGTHAGWLLGTKLLNLDWPIVGYSVSRDPAEAILQIARLANEAAAWLGFECGFSAADVQVEGGFIGPGYGIPSPVGAAAIKRLARAAGVLLDPVYTGKAMAGYLNGLGAGAFDACGNVIFLHSGGEPAFFAGNGEWLNIHPQVL